VKSTAIPTVDETPFCWVCQDPVAPGENLCRVCREEVRAVDVAKALRPIPRGPWPQQHRDGLD